MRMSLNQWRRLDVVERIDRGEMTIAEAAQALGLSRRQVQRVRKRVRLEGQVGVVHRNSGRAPKHKISSLVRDRVVALRRGKYAGFNDQHFTEKLSEQEQLGVSRASVRRWLRAAGIASPRGRRAPKHRQRRDRRPQAGQMILWDGSRHDWLEARGPRLCLMGAIDDATGELLPGAHFVEEECTLGYLRVLLAIVKGKGVPVAAYMDRHGTLKRNDKNWTLDEQLAGRQEPTQVGRALDELGIQVLYALSPQAKGRVERLWGTLQDRLVSELRLVGARTADDANEVLRRYRVDHNQRFAVPAAEANPAWRSCPPGVKAEEACALVYARRVANNNTVRIDGEIIDIPKKPNAGRSTYAKALVLVRHLLDGRFRVFFDEKMIAQTKARIPRGPHGSKRTIEAWKRHQARVAEDKRLRGIETTRAWQLRQKQLDEPGRVKNEGG
jgi:transposase